MTVRGRKVWWLAGVGFGALLIGLGILLLRDGLEDADRWASVFGVFLNVAGLAVAVYSAVWTRRAVSAPTPSAAAGAQVKNRIRRGRFAAPVVQARNVEQVSTGPAPAPVPAPPPTGGVEPGSVSNLIEDGQFHNLVIQGQDVRGLHLPAAGQADTRPGQEE